MARKLYVKLYLLLYTRTTNTFISHLPNTYEDIKNSLIIKTTVPLIMASTNKMAQWI